MKEIAITARIHYIEAGTDPLSADIGIVKEENSTWLYDCGNGDESLSHLKGHYNVVLSHFHPDHIGNIGKIIIDNLYVSKETFRYLPSTVKENVKIHIVAESMTLGNLHIFPIPSSHAKGSLGLEVDGEYAFLGDALYSASKKGRYVYNVQFLKEEIETLKGLSSTHMLVSHLKGLARTRDEVIKELEDIYSRREKGCNEIPLES